MRTRPHIMVIVLWLFILAMLFAGVALILSAPFAEGSR